MEPESSLPHSQAPATCPYPQPEQSIPCLSIPLLIDPVQYYIPILPNGLYPSGLPTKTLHALFMSPDNCYMPNPSYTSWFGQPNTISCGPTTGIAPNKLHESP